MTAGCLSSGPVSRIDEHRELYDQWPIEMRQAVLDGKVELGMTPEMVEMAIGKPTEIQRRAVSSGEGEDMLWIYRPVVFADDPGPYGRGRPPTGEVDPSVNPGSISTAPNIGQYPPIGSSLPKETKVVDERIITFCNGVVLRADPPLPKV